MTSSEVKLGTPDPRRGALRTAGQGWVGTTSLSVHTKAGAYSANGDDQTMTDESRQEGLTLRT